MTYERWGTPSGREGIQRTLDPTNEDDLAFVDGVRRLAAEADYQKLQTRFGTRRTDARFWAHSDSLADAYRRWAPKEAGLFDYSRFENR